MPYVASIETDAGTYQHGFHLGSDEVVARITCVDFAAHLTPKVGTYIVTVGLMLDGRLVDTWEGDGWASDRQFLDDDGEES